MKRIDHIFCFEDVLLEDNDCVTPEVALWRAVITQQLVDAGSNSKIRYAKYRKAQAIAWLAGTSQSFLEVCALADLDPDYVRKRSRLALKRNCIWRKYNPNSYKGHKRNKKPNDL